MGQLAPEEPQSHSDLAFALFFRCRAAAIEEGVRGVQDAGTQIGTQKAAATVVAQGDTVILYCGRLPLPAIPWSSTQ